MNNGASPRPLTILVWMLVIATLLIGGWKLMHLDHHSHDQKVLIEKSNTH